MIPKVSTARTSIATRFLVRTLSAWRKWKKRLVFPVTLQYIGIHSKVLCRNCTNCRQGLFRLWTVTEREPPYKTAIPLASYPHLLLICGPNCYVVALLVWGHVCAA